MNERDIRQIRINNSLIGIVGLEAVLHSMADEYAACSDGDIGAEMMRRLEEMNYIPAKVRPLYAEALVREFRKHLGQPVPEVVVSGVHVAVLGPGCAQCDRLENDVREVMEEMGLAGELTHVADMREIGRYGVLGVPALVINEKVVCVGQAPNRNKIREWLEAAQKP